MSYEAMKTFLYLQIWGRFLLPKILCDFIGVSNKIDKKTGLTLVNTELPPLSQDLIFKNTESISSKIFVTMMAMLNAMSVPE